MTIGVQAGPDQIADGKDPSVLVSVVPAADGSNAQETFGFGIDSQTGAKRASVVDAAGRAVISDTDKLTLILLEMRLQTFYLAEIAAGRIVADDPEVLRSDFDATGLLTSLS